MDSNLIPCGIFYFIFVLLALASQMKSIKTSVASIFFFQNSFDFVCLYIHHQGPSTYFRTLF